MKHADPSRASHSARFFKTGPGEYGEGDRFLGLTVPQVRVVAKQCAGLSIGELKKLAESEWHEVRLCALHAMDYRALSKKTTDAQRLELFNLYVELMAAGCVNNWDLVDTSAPRVIGGPLLGSDRSILFEWVKSPNLWYRRVALLATFHFIAHGDASTSLQLAAEVLHDKEDLIHKAAGWMLRELGKRVGVDLLHEFLSNHAAAMPRTMLRYAIEHLSPEQRAHYMAAKG